MIYVMGSMHNDVVGILRRPVFLRRHVSVPRLIYVQGLSHFCVTGAEEVWPFSKPELKGFCALPR